MKNLMLVMVIAIMTCGCGEVLKETNGGGYGNNVVPAPIVYHNPSFNYTDDGVIMSFTVTENYLSTNPNYRNPYIKQIKYTGFTMNYTAHTPKISEYIGVTWTDPNSGTFTIRTMDTSLTVNASGVDSEYYISYGNGDSGSWYYTVTPLRSGLPPAEAHFSQLEKVSGNYIELYKNGVFVEKIVMNEM